MMCRGGLFGSHSFHSGVESRRKEQQTHLKYGQKFYGKNNGRNVCPENTIQRHQVKKLSIFIRRSAIGYHLNQ